MSDILNNLLEKFKKVEGGPLDPKRSGADGKEDDFIGKHIDNIEVTDGPGVEKEKGHPHNSGEKAKFAKRKPHKGYEPGEDAEVYESADEGYDIEDFYAELDEEVEVDMDMLQEDAVFFMQIIDEAVAEFIEEEADEEEKAMLEEMMSTDEGVMELLDALFEGEGKKCGECGEDIEDCECDDHDHDGDDDDVIDDKPKLKGTKKQDATEGYGKKKMKEGEGDEGGASVVTKRADTKVVKTRTPDGKVIWRKQKSNIKVK